MTDYVLTLAVGPVQSFIASARRSRDLWAGSWLLSELAKAVAKNLHQNKAELIFPFIYQTDDLKPNEKDLEPNSEFSVGNKIQAVITADSVEQLKKIADSAKATANEHFQQIAQKVKENLGNGESLRQNLWKRQVIDYVEVQYAWAEIINGDYHQASETAAQLLAARKATRDFSPLAVSADDSECRIPKSSLDGARETVLPEKQSESLRKKLGLSQSEQLDCVGVVKRLCGNAEQFTPITRVAANDWIEQVHSHENFVDVKACYDKLVQSKLATCVSGNNRIYANFPYDAQYLYSSRLNVAIAKATTEELSLLADLQKALKPIWSKYGEPCPYYAMLLADGDKMGELLDKAKTKENHQDITENLSKFAQQVPDIMRHHQAQCIYSGGDDVLGLVTLSNALECANELRESFSEHLKSISEQLKASTPTLSVGLAICHVNTPLGAVRALAKRAEKVAKGDGYPQNKQRNALGITLAIRSGSTIDMRLRWEEENNHNKTALKILKQWVDAYSKNELSSRVAYDCRNIFMRTDFATKTEYLDDIRATELKLMLSKARDSCGKPLNEQLIKQLEERLQEMGDLNQLATELIIARWLAAKTQRDLGRNN